MVEWLFLAVQWGCLRFLIVVFPDHTYLLLLTHLTLYTDIWMILLTLIMYILTIWYVKYTCTSELQLNKANTSDTEATFLDLHLSSSNDTVCTKIYNKRNDFEFEIVNFPILDGDFARSRSCGILSPILRLSEPEFYDYLVYNVKKIVGLTSLTQVQIGKERMSSSFLGSVCIPFHHL